MPFHPYLYFAGNARPAFERYHEIFGGELQIMSGHDAPPDSGIPENKMDLVMHAALMTDGDLLMASDSYEGDFEPKQATYVHYATTDLDRAKHVFAGLSEGAEIHVDGQVEFWTPFFGQLIDQFGIPWQVSVEPKESSA